MKTLVAFYSRTNTTRKVAKSIAQSLKADIEDIQSVADRSGAMGYLNSGMEATRKKAAAIKDPEKKASDYDLVIIGTPVWSWTVSSPIRAYLMQQKGMKKVAFFATQGGSGSDRAFSEMEKLCKKKPIATETFLTKDVVKSRHEEKMKLFITELRKK